ncbi:MAG: hypothetical protein ABR936_16140 [Bacteroidota bacterium]|jgi:hypothetical protein
MSGKVSNSQPSWINYKPGDKNSIGEIIKSIYNLTSTNVIYTVEPDDSIHWELDVDLCPNNNNVISSYQILFSRAKSVLPKRKTKIAHNMLIAGLIKGLESDKLTPEINYFKEAELFIDNMQNESVHFRYVATALLITILSIIPAISYYYFFGSTHIYNILVGCFFGSIGAFVSILQRFQTIHILKYSSWRYIVLRAISRILIGTIFGALFIIVQKAGIVLNIINANDFLIYAFSFMSGLSERYFPELMQSIQTQEFSKPKIK